MENTSKHIENLKMLTKLSDRDRIGPGVWFMLHLLALESEKNDELKKAYPSIIKIIKEKFPCEECRLHFNKFVDKFGVEENEKIKYGYFKWSYIVHDAVNERLEKPTPDYEDTYRWFLDPKATCNSCVVHKRKPIFST